MNETPKIIMETLEKLAENFKMASNEREQLTTDSYAKDIYESQGNSILRKYYKRMYEGFKLQ